MSTEDVYRRLRDALEAAGIPYMITGSVASIMYGTPRSTLDIDVVISPSEEQLKGFVGSLDPQEYYVDLEAALDALARRSMFNVLDWKSGWKFDFIIKKARAFNQVEFDRRVPADFNGVRLFVATAEDMVLAKLEWAAEGESERQLRDVAGILHGMRGALDMSYLETWIKNLAIENEWAKAKRIADSIPPPPEIPLRS